MSAFGGKADVAADDLEGDAMRLLGDGGQSDKAVVLPPSLFRLPARAGQPHGATALIKATAARWRENLGSFG